MADWQPWVGRLENEGDDAVDELTALLLSTPPDPTATTIAIKALSAARSDLSVRSAALALAWVATDDDTDSVDQLEQAYDSRRSHVFLAPALLSSLTLLGLRNPTARTGAARYLLKLKVGEPGPLLVAGAKAIGVLCDRFDLPDLRMKLVAIAGSSDVPVRAEARCQLALMRLADALLADSGDGLTNSLSAAREAFRVAEESEEVRPDATLFRLLLDAVLQFAALERDRSAAAVGVKKVAAQLRDMGGRLAEEIFRMDRSPAASQVASQCAVVASALETAAAEVESSVRWTNFDCSVVRLAECYGEVRYRPAALVGNDQAFAALSSVADRVLKPRLGPVLALKVGRESFEQVIRNYESSGGQQEILDGLKALQEASIEAERVKGFRLSSEGAALLYEQAKTANCTPDELVRRFNLTLSANGGNGLALGIELLPQGARMNGSGLDPKVRLVLSGRLVTRWTELAIYFDIPPSDKAKFKQGHEPEHIFEWLEQRSRLGELRGAFDHLKWPDLIEELDRHPW
ncbi:hypothetical protein VT84_06375 [Gemmata sp. SH-PL17]|uniref:hypothetical protein n=1 Tax=Gemmata sp. SH-PL17 TaxID=1630693 RepID=UPI00078B256E|nr:hypothetical protein [Gemmata sp. SH-PL17]AMV24002.1 hypothetical protein VT84_06375 [Gemmata sp. SH-PL17]